MEHSTCFLWPTYTNCIYLFRSIYSMRSFCLLELELKAKQRNNLTCQKLSITQRLLNFSQLYDAFCWIFFEYFLTIHYVFQEHKLTWSHYCDDGWENTLFHRFIMHHFMLDCSFWEFLTWKYYIYHVLRQYDYKVRRQIKQLSLFRQFPWYIFIYTYIDIRMYKYVEIYVYMCVCVCMCLSAFCVCS